VEIYESILQDSHGGVTTGLLTAVGYAKDNRLLPHGFDKTTASPDIAVHGEALSDQAFTGGGHRLRYSVDVGGAAGPFELQVDLMYQPIGFRWAKNLQTYDARETTRFTGYFDATASVSAAMLAQATATSR
jgi:hypothetical protein